MASVYTAKDLNLGRDVALKLFAPQSADPDELRRQEAEIELLATLNHPSLVTLFDAGTDTRIPEEPRPFLTMELVDGQDLRTRIRHSPLPLDELAVVGAGIADALAYVHGLGIVHRDIKPANILLVPVRPGEPLRPKLTDFGIARIIDGTRLTATGTMVGTAAYLSPGTGPRRRPRSGERHLLAGPGPARMPQGRGGVPGQRRRIRRGPPAPRARHSGRRARGVGPAYPGHDRPGPVGPPRGRRTRGSLPCGPRFPRIAAGTGHSGTHPGPPGPAGKAAPPTQARSRSGCGGGNTPPELAGPGCPAAAAAPPPLLSRGAAWFLRARPRTRVAVLLAALAVLAVVATIAVALSAPAAPDVVPYPTVTGTARRSPEGTAEGRGTMSDSRTAGQDRGG